MSVWHGSNWVDMYAVSHVTAVCRIGDIVLLRVLAQYAPEDKDEPVAVWTTVNSVYLPARDEDALLCDFGWDYEMPLTLFQEHITDRFIEAYDADERGLSQTEIWKSAE